MTSIITRSDILSAVMHTIEDREVQQIAIQAINRAYVDEHTGSFSNDNESMFFNLVTHYDMLHSINPARYNQARLTEEAHHAFLD